MLGWLQDLNWPGASEIVEALAGVPEGDLAGYVSRAAECAMEKGDAEWLVGLRRLVCEVSLTSELIADSRIRAILLDREADSV